MKVGTVAGSDRVAERPSQARVGLRWALGEITMILSISMLELGHQAGLHATDVLGFARSRRVKEAPVAKMTPRQRVLAALNRRVPDRVPKHALFTPFQLQQVRERTGFENPADAFGFEVRSVGFRPAKEEPDFSRYLPPDLPPGTTSDEWGLTEKPGTFYHFTEYVYPMANLTDVRELDDWPFPDYTPAYRFDGVPEEIASWQEQGYYVSGGVGHIFETSWYIRSMEQLFIDWRFNKAFAERLLDEITERRLYMAVKYAEAGADGLGTGDDVGTQRGMLMSPEQWRHWLKPRWARVIAAAKSVKPDILVTYHSDGDISTIIPELAEMSPSE